MINQQIDLSINSPDEFKHRKGQIKYIFKGKPMHPLTGTILSQTEDQLVVSDDAQKLHIFVLIQDQWVLKEGSVVNSPLNGTIFIENE